MKNIANSIRRKRKQSKTVISTLPKIVVVTPVKNEAWILDRFLSVTTQFADCVIVADQQSTDKSAEICHKYGKVLLIQNHSNQYDEAERQLLLIQAAREAVPEHKIILALDADEILAANALTTVGWQTMLKAEQGTILYFEKPDLYLSPSQCIRYDVPWPLGYVDDGSEHFPKQIHSIRIPIPENSPRLYLHEVKILHYGLVRIEAQESKARMYSILENVLGTLPFWHRRLVYRSGTDWTQRGKLMSSPDEWFRGWENIGIDMKSIQHQKFYWYDYEVLRYMKQYGERKFWFDDIWWFDWNQCCRHARNIGIKNIPEKITPPPKVFTIFMKTLGILLRSLKWLKQR